MNKITYKTLALNVQSILEELKSTNSYYAEAKGEDFFERIAKGQHPKATLLGCSDARFKVRASNLQVEDEDDVFVIRNIGNQFIVAEGSIEYGIYHLHTPLLLVMGHSRCGAVQAAISEYRQERLAIRREINHLALPIRKYIGKDLTNEAWLEAVKDNVNFQIEECMQRFKHEVKSGKLTIVGLIYDFANDMKNGYGKINPININGDSNLENIKNNPLLKSFFE